MAAGRRLSLPERRLIIVRARNVKIARQSVAPITISLPAVSGPALRLRFRFRRHHYQRIVQQSDVMGPPKVRADRWRGAAQVVSPITLSARLNQRAN